MGLFTWLGFKQKGKHIPERNIDEIKRICRVLFIDDHAFPVIDILKESGWSSTGRIRDVESLDQHEIRDAHVIFVDIQGIGRKLKFKDEGLGVIVALRKKYPNKKLVAYSAEDQGQVQAFHEGINLADSRISKNADPYQFQFLLEKFAMEAFSFNECIERIRQLLIKELGSTPDTQTIIAKLGKIYKQDDYTPDAIGKIFNLQNAANLSSIIQLFLTARA